MKRYTLGSSSIGDLEKQYVNQVLDSNFISPGPVVEYVEKEGARLHGLKHGLAINSGQMAIHVAIQALTAHIKDRKPLVAVPACTYISTLAAAILAGCDIVLVDVEVPSANMCPIDLNKVLWHFNKIGRPVDVVVPVHLFGKACSDEVRETCKRYRVKVVEDACEATFVPHIGWGDILTTSFYANHLISGGGGGLIMTNYGELDFKCWQLINHGRSGRFNNNDIHRISEKFHFSEWGHSAKWNDVSAAIVKAQIERRKELYEARERNAFELIKILWPLESDKKLIQLPDPNGHCFMMFPIVLSKHLDTLRVIKELNNNGIEIRRLMPITNQPVVQNYFKNIDLEKEYPNADLLNRQGFYIGTHPELSIDDIREMGDIVYNTILKEDAHVNS